MGLLGLLRPKKRGGREGIWIGKSADSARDKKQLWADSSSIAPDEKQFYQPDEYYTFETHPGSQFNQRVVTFDERKEISYPSRGGLYVAEIMLLDYCRKGTYPKPKKGYPGFWWFQYGIRDVGSALASLEMRGFIRWAPKSRCINECTVVELRDLLKREGLPTSGKKQVLIDRIVSNVPDEHIPIDEAARKYELTPRGVAELEENGYVPYMHSHSRSTVEGLQFGASFTVWDINKLFANGVDGDWRHVVGELEEERFGINMASHASEVGEPIKAKPVSADTLRSFLENKRDFISEEISSSGDGFDDASLGYDYEAMGEDPAALVQYYIAAGKKVDIPAVYDRASCILHRYGLDDEAVKLLDQGLRSVSRDNTHWRELHDKRAKLMKANN